MIATQTPTTLDRPKPPSSPSTASSRAAVNPNGDFPLRAFFGHHKCATGWTDGILREACWRMGLNFQIVHTPDDFAGHDGLTEFVTSEGVDFLAYTNANAEIADPLPFHSAFHIVRDPRDVLVSGYFSHRYSHGTDGWPELIEHRQRLQSATKDEGLFLEMDFSRPFFDDMDSWDYEHPNVLELRMEDITQRPRDGFREVFSFMEMLDVTPRRPASAFLNTLKLRMNRLNRTGRRFMPGNVPMFPVPPRRVSAIPYAELMDVLEKKSFARMTGGRKRGDENVNSHYRKGVPGDWQNHFTSKHKSVFKDRYQPLLEKLGYESNADW